MNSPSDPSSQPPDDRSVPGPREGADGWVAPGYGDPYAAPSTGPYTGPSGGGPDPYGSGGPFGPGTAGWAPKPGVVPLRPLGLGELLDGAVSYVRAHPRAVLGTSAVVAVVAHLIGVPLTQLLGGGQADPGPTPDLAELTRATSTALTARIPQTVVVSLATTVLSGLLMVVVSRSVLGAPVDATEAWRATRPRAVGLVGLALLTGLLLGLVMVVGMLPGALLFAAGARAAGAVVLVLGVLAALLAVLALGVALSLGPPVYMLEGGGVIDALRRSWVLVRPRFWPVLGITLLASAVAYVAGQILTLVFVGLGAGAGALVGPGVTATVLTVLFEALGGVIAMAVVTPFQAGVTGLLYVDQRMRREGFDIELQRAAAFGPR